MNISKRGQIGIWVSIGALFAAAFLVMFSMTQLNPHGACFPSYDRTYDCAQSRDCVVKQTALNNTFKYSTNGVSGQYIYSYDMIAGWNPCRKDYIVTFGNFEIKKMETLQPETTKLQQNISNVVGQIIWNEGLECTDTNVTKISDNVVKWIIKDSLSNTFPPKTLGANGCYILVLNPGADPFKKTK